MTSILLYLLQLPCEVSGLLGRLSMIALDILDKLLLLSVRVPARFFYKTTSLRRRLRGKAGHRNSLIAGALYGSSVHLAIPKNGIMPDAVLEKAAWVFQK